VECMSDVTAGLLQREEKLKRVAISLMIRGAGSVLAFALVFAWLRSLPAAVGAMTLVWIAVLLFYDLHNVRTLIAARAPLFRFDWQQLWRLMMLGLPLGWVATFASLNANIPRYFVQHYLGLADQGIYATLAYLAIGMGLAVFALTQSVTTRLARLYAGRDVRGFSRLLVKLSMLGIVIIVVGVPLSLLLGRPFLTIVYSADYSNQVGLLALFVATSGITTISAFVFCGMSAARRFRSQLPVYLATITICTVGAAILTPRFGVLGAGLAVSISSIVTAMLGIWVLVRSLKSHNPT